MAVAGVLQEAICNPTKVEISGAINRSARFGQQDRVVEVGVST